MAVLLRDDFTGSGVLAGRLPDGVNGGVWVDEPRYAGGNAATQTVITGGLCKGTSGSANWGAQAALPGSPADAYIEAGIRVTPGNTVGIAIRKSPVGSGPGVFVEFGYDSPTTAYVNSGYNGSWLTGETPSGQVTPTVADPTNYVVRLETEGNEFRIYVDGTLVMNGEIRGPLIGGDIYLDGQFSSGGFSYVEAGTLGAPPAPPPFWTGYVLTSEVTA